MSYVARDNRAVIRYDSEIYGSVRPVVRSLARGPAGGISGGRVGGDGCCEAEMDRKWRREVQMQNEYRRGLNLASVSFQTICTDKGPSRSVETNVLRHWKIGKDCSAVRHYKGVL